MRTILLTGCDGYVGWPTLLKLKKEFPNDRIIGVDNGARREWVEEVESKSIIPIKSFSKRQEIIRNENVNMIQMDLINTKQAKYQNQDFKCCLVLSSRSPPNFADDIQEFFGERNCF